MTASNPDIDLVDSFLEKLKYRAPSTKVAQLLQSDNIRPKTRRALVRMVEAVDLCGDSDKIPALAPEQGEPDYLPNHIKDRAEYLTNCQEALQAALTQHYEERYGKVMDRSDDIQVVRDALAIEQTTRRIIPYIVQQRRSTDAKNNIILTSDLDTEFTPLFIHYLATRGLNQAEQSNGGERLQAAFKIMADTKTEADCAPDIWAAIQSVKTALARFVEAHDLVKERITRKHLSSEIPRDIEQVEDGVLLTRQHAQTHAIIADNLPILAQGLDGAKDWTDRNNRETANAFLEALDEEINADRTNTKWGGDIFTRDRYTLNL